MKSLRLFAIGLAGIVGFSLIPLPALAGNNDRLLSEKALEKHRKKYKYNYSARQTFIPDRFENPSRRRGFFSFWDAFESPDGDIDPTPEAPPDPDRNIGPYAPVKLVSLSDPALAAAKPGQVLASTILYKLRDSETAVRVTPAQRDAILAFYASRGFEPVWVTSEGLSAKGAGALALMADADAEGMVATDYLPPLLSGFGDDGKVLKGDVVHLAMLDIGMTAAVLRYADQAYGGRILPNKLSRYYDIAPPALALPEALNSLAAASDAATYLRSLQPTHPAYQAMRNALAQLRAKTSESTEEPIPAGARVKVGERDARIPLVRARLVKLGHLAEANAGDWRKSVDTDAYMSGSFEVKRTARGRADAEKLDKPMSKALQAFQESQKIKVTGRLDAATVNAFNERTDSRNLQKLVMNMERVRWLPRDLGPKYIMVNQAAFELRLMDSGKISWSTKVIVGKPQTQTSVFSDEMEMVVVNPYWGVPGSIIKHEMLPMLMRDPYYLDRKGFEVVAPGGRVVSSGEVDWWAYGDRIPFDVRQPPGDDNALGNIKFLFPNSHDIYMHDTPTKNLFGQSVRAFSHGCVRVENPRELAVRVLGWDRNEVDGAIASGENMTVNLPSKIPVHLTYFTTWIDPSGKLIYLPDIYGRDKRLESALNRIAVAAN